MAKVSIDLHPTEEIIALIRRSPFMYAWGFVIGVLWTVLSLVLFFPLIHLGWFGWCLLIFGFLSGCWYLTGIWRRWHETVFLVTSERIVDIDRSHWRRRFIYEWNVADLVSAKVESEGLLLRLFGLKTVHIMMKNPKMRIECHGIRHAENVKQLLDEVQSM